ncbi:hypothetical protein GWK47_003463 [Chionoecetes opilio]|uniref:Secreted protein n=1 Tax=Chionoecetes opilio TaxID=41210 RepID=A0A8J5CR45_CHIOP|nr:hypothetical protein GWK47_003463 [Chionoecetes opilio]
MLAGSADGYILLVGIVSTLPLLSDEHCSTASADGGCFQLPREQTVHLHQHQQQQALVCGGHAWAELWPMYRWRPRRNTQPLPSSLMCWPGSLLPDRYCRAAHRHINTACPPHTKGTLMMPTHSSSTNRCTS